MNSAETQDIPTERGVQGRMLNCILYCDSCFGHLENVERPFIASTFISTLTWNSDLLSIFAQMWHNVISIGHPAILDQTRLGLLAWLTNHFTTKGAPLTWSRSFCKGSIIGSDRSVLKLFVFGRTVFKNTFNMSLHNKYIYKCTVNGILLTWSKKLTLTGWHAVKINQFLNQVIHLLV